MESRDLRSELGNEIITPVASHIAILITIYVPRIPTIAYDHAWSHMIMAIYPVNGYAICLSASDELTSAVEHMTIVVHFKEQAHGQGTLLAHALNGLADMHLRLEQYVEAAELYERAFAMAGRRGDDIMDQAIWYGRGRALIGMGQFIEAMALLEQAYSWAFHRYGENNRLTIEYQSLLERARHGVQEKQEDE